MVQCERGRDGERPIREVVGDVASGWVGLLCFLSYLFLNFHLYKGSRFEKHAPVSC